MATTPTGLINATATGYDPAQAQAAQWQVTPEQTVQGQIKNIIDSNSPLMKQTETTGLQQANKRGLMNSSMAVGATQAELYKVAAPIASADATTNANAGEFNASTKQQTELANQNASNTASQFGANATNDASKFNASESNNILKLGMDIESKQQLAQTEANYKTLMQSSAGASDLYKTMVANASEIMSNANMDAATKSTAIKNQITLLNSGLAIIGQIGNLDLTDLLTFDVPGV